MDKQESNREHGMRLDKWLWCARFYKTRGAAVEAIKSGKVQSHEKKLKPSHNIQLAEQLTIRRGQFKWHIEVIGLASQRKSAKEAILLYRESEESIESRKLLEIQLQTEYDMYPRHRGRPTKRERRDMQKFTRG